MPVSAPAEGTELLIANGPFLHRNDFTSGFIDHGTSSGTLLAAIDWDAAATAHASGGPPCSGGERRILQLAVSLQNTVTGIDEGNVALLVPRHPACGWKTTRERQVTSGIQGEW